ncbi:MAG: YdcF family protein [Pseudolabrys sp.]
MFFVLSKTLALLLLPSNFLILLILLGLVLALTRWRRAGLRLTGVSAILLALFGSVPIGVHLQNVLENRFPRWDASRGAPDGIVVLGGVINPLLSRVRGQPAINGNAERVTAIAKLARDYPNARIIFSSGDASLLRNEGAEADELYPLLDTFGVPRSRVTLENRARNTVENATFSKELAGPKPGERWLVVTSAFHMPRAMGCFRRAGFAVEAYPVDWRTYPRPSWQPQLGFVRGLGALDAAVHEWIGLLAYRLTGKTDALFPAP